ncbi:MAG: 23S rRNA (guanosine(2251)-2'-O)-methyltransferase RlmB [Bacteroidetes bacterium GWC2_33_15]|nr:MAG: 23S rRNA (guanosine(2251)-2'-O)-methyltransferase RlmB [Bacteroidetes bacterium GWA2_33_15]OFX50409.1 MAG: 23S rRNA (guanosine(2251)-2'-O)-methyltransferase RlmB [Bacteroidetes bacterium GWC2_33_15]OFX66673.1 MAG: 23S rRNA (guanosine(2251)-2'-O)-methyltransferase RlmB [Bacteroidetes bacterium GWB2_32_14]OFX69291.1 MAG: 23S rRNA (guanosine(2251)-2'-O)-methyltransferase RlmB [Bacteroidetes bacterium GWD2_33_33]HAN18606.1 23S rRNA (guanosine(2251)-2'-O)-methyltransferase RlmB [Bacteroidale
MTKETEFIFGIRSVIEAIKADKLIDKLMIRRGLTGELSHELLNLVKEYQIPYQLVPNERINRVTQKNHQGVVAFISPIEFQNIEQIVPSLFEAGKTPLLVILDKVTDVRNFGAITRTCECAAANAIIIPEKGSARISGDAVKTSAGALHKIPVCRVQNLAQTIKFLKSSGIQVVAATEKAADLYYEIDFSLPTAILLGAEDKGVEVEYLRISDKLVKIPVLGEIESLNVSVAAGILMYEAVKQRLA